MGINFLKARATSRRKFTFYGGQLLWMWLNVRMLQVFSLEVVWYGDGLNITWKEFCFMIKLQFLFSVDNHKFVFMFVKYIDDQGPWKTLMKELIFSNEWTLLQAFSLIFTTMSRTQSMCCICFLSAGRLLSTSVEQSPKFSVFSLLKEINATGRYLFLCFSQI